MARSNVFTSLALQHGYHQIKIAPEHQHHAAFVCKWGLYEYKVMPFGLTNTPSTFQCFTNEQLVGLEHCARVYMNDIIVHSADVLSYLGHLREVLHCMRDRKLAVKRKKCEFKQDKLVYLRHVVQAGGVSPDPAKVVAIAKLASPADISQ